MMNSFRYVILLITIRLKQACVVFFSVLRGKVSYYPLSVKKLEVEFAAQIGSKYSLMFSNATSAIEAALFSLNVGPSSVVGSTAFVIPSSYSSVVSLGAQVRFYDIAPETLNINHELVINDKASKLSVLIITHFYGNPCDMETIMEWANKHGVFVIEDCSHAHGASFGGKELGSWGDIGVFSLQGAKAVSAGEGALVVTNHSDLITKMAAYGHQGSYRKFSFYDETIGNEHPSFGYGKKMRAHPIGADIASVDLRYLSYKNSIYSKWLEELDSIINEESAFYIPRVLSSGIRGGFCQGVPLVFKNEEKALEFEGNVKGVINVFKRGYLESIYYFSNISSDIEKEVIVNNLSNTIECFDRVVFVPFYQFVYPGRWKYLIKKLKNI